MYLSVNGSPIDVPPGMTVMALLERMQLDPCRVAVERNLDVVPRRSYAAQALAEGDQVEIVTFVGGG